MNQRVGMPHEPESEAEPVDQESSTSALEDKSLTSLKHNQEQCYLNYAKCLLNRRRKRFDSADWAMALYTNTTTAVTTAKRA